MDRLYAALIIGASIITGAVLNNWDAFRPATYAEQRIAVKMYRLGICDGHGKFTRVVKRYQPSHQTLAVLEGFCAIREERSG